MNTPFNILLPVKHLDHCKQRLASVLTLQERQQLVIALLKQNLRILIDDFPEHHVLVITPDPNIASLAKHFNVSVLVEPFAQGLNAAVETGARWSLKQGYRTQVVLAPDIAQLDTNELQLFFDQAQAPTTVMIGTANDGGTNALLTRPPNAIPFQFGLHSSTHMQHASQQRGIDCQRLHFPHLSLDIDTPDDLARWKIIDEQHTNRCGVSA